MGNNNIVETYNVEEEFLYEKTYLFIKGYAVGRNLNYVLKALPLARKVHNGQYRKGTVDVEGKVYRLPYVLHVLKVASTLISLNLPFSNEELDVLISAALLHDVLEDAENGFFHDEYELVTRFGFSDEIYNIVKLVSKRAGATKEELEIYFNNIKKNKFALLVKLADRSHNVEDLYHMNIDKIYKYIKETITYIYPLCDYAKDYYPEISNGVTILKTKIVSLIETTNAIIEIFNNEHFSNKVDIETKDFATCITKLKKSFLDFANLYLEIINYIYDKENPTNDRKTCDDMLSNVFFHDKDVVEKIKFIEKSKEDFMLF